MTLASMPCSFCAQIAGESEHNAVLMLMPEERFRRPVLAESANAVVMPSIGALTSGHVLVSPKQHLRSSLAGDDDVVSDVIRLADEVQAHLANTTAQGVHRFEHGSSLSGDRIACSIDHAHIHLVPADVTIIGRISAMGAWEPAPTHVEELQERIAAREYLLYEAPTAERLVATTTKGFPSQMLRQVLAESLAIGAEWNWRTHPAHERMHSTIDLFARMPVISPC